MRKHKSVVAALLAVMMVFAFMPTMAFATPDKGEWDSDLNSYATRTWLNDGDGDVEMSITEAQKAGLDSAAYAARYHYYDLSAAAPKVSKSYTFAAFKALTTTASDGIVKLTSPTLVLTKPSNATAKVSGTSSVTFNATSDYEVEVVVDGFNADSFDAQTVTLKTSVTARNYASDGAAAQKKLVGTVPDVTVAIDAQKATENGVNFYVDEVKSANKIAGNAVSKVYTGKTMTLVNNTVPGFTVAYKLQDSKTKAYNATSAVTFKNAGDYYAMAEITKNATGKVVRTEYFKITVTKSTKVLKFGFNKSVTSYQTNAGEAYAKVAKDADPIDYIDVENILGDDKEEALKYFKDKYEITATPDKVNSNYVDWKIEKKSGVNDATLATTYKTLFANYTQSTTNVFGLGTNDEVRVELVDASKLATEEDDITFTTAPNSKTYKANKKGKLAKAKKFKVVAVADSGKAVKYQISSPTKKIKINASTGKITVKKGLKKGTYTVTVKAKTVKGDGYKAAKDSLKIKIKIKKK